jgi:hypothetical protein
LPSLLVFQTESLLRITLNRTQRDQFREATRTKLVLEIAGLQPPPRVIPAAGAAPRISCLIGERMWQERWGGGGIDFR